MVEKCCSTCARLHFEFPNDTSWDACDYTCHKQIKQNGEIVATVIEFLFCSHGMSESQLKRKLRSMGRKCSEWTRKSLTC